MAGVMFAVVLMLLQGGIYFGFILSASAVIDHCPADVWIAPAMTVNFESAWLFSEDDLVAIKGTPGILWAEGLIHTFGYLRLPGGEGRWAQIVGFNPDTGIGGPWEMARGSFADLKKPGTYIVDESSLPQLEGVTVGDKMENFNRKMEIVGLSRGAKTYTTYPIMFTSFRTAQTLPFLEGMTNYVVAKLEDGADPGVTLERLRRFGRFDVLTRDEFTARTRTYWATKTGIGIGIGVTIALGFIVGLVIVGQTMYASTIERIREYATLKALGATNLEVCSIIWAQAALVGAAGCGSGMLVSLLVKATYSGQVVAVYFPVMIFPIMIATTLAMCLGASLLSIRRVLRVDPAMVFRA
ncbi:MAG: FtsX-like permease family protein [Planctomycetes bacterium]|nr:FtsX-like permease family protein [Planctomycetota bacterium]